MNLCGDFSEPSPISPILLLFVDGRFIPGRQKAVAALVYLLCLTELHEVLTVVTVRQ